MNERPITSIGTISVGPAHNRLPTTGTPVPPERSFIIAKDQKSYRHQYANIYFVRLRLLRNFTEKQAQKRWSHLEGKPMLVPRVLEVVKSRLCYIIGTVYMDMPLKPDVMEEIAHDHSLPAPPLPAKYYSPDDSVMLEDESGRIKLVGESISQARLVTGVIIGVLGAETAHGDFEVVDICYPEMAPLLSTEPLHEGGIMDAEGTSARSSRRGEWIALVSGLHVGASTPADGLVQLLAEYLICEAGGMTTQSSASQISRLIIAGNSLDTIVSNNSNNSEDPEQRKQRRYGADTTEFSPHPVMSLSKHLHDIAQAMPIHILPGETDPAGAIMPQQPFPRAMFGSVSHFATFVCETNPTYIRLTSGLQLEDEDPSENMKLTRTILVNAGQPLDDMFKYLPSPPHSRLATLESTLRWRHMAPTAPDTLWCHPYFGGDPFIITECPDIYVVGNQKRFATKLVRTDVGNATRPDQPTGCRIILVPEFYRTGVVVLVNLLTLEVKTVQLKVEGMTGGMNEDVGSDHGAAPSPSSPDGHSNAELDTEHP